MVTTISNPYPISKGHWITKITVKGLCTTAVLFTWRAPHRIYGFLLNVQYLTNLDTYFPDKSISESANYIKAYCL